MFFGSYQYTLDDKGRLVIPVKMRSESGPVLFAMRGFEQCLSLYTQATFSQFVSEVTTYDYKDPQVRQYIRTALASVIELTIPAGATQLAVDLYFRTNSAGEEWWIDNMELYRLEPDVFLPVELISFDGEQIDNGISLNWKTDICALGGISNKNINKIKITKTRSVGIKSWIYKI
jgi:hypothetical protein